MNARHGNGTLKSANGRRLYVGGFSLGKRSGYGKETYLNGNVYEGQFEDDKRHG